MVRSEHTEPEPHYVERIHYRYKPTADFLMRPDQGSHRLFMIFRDRLWQILAKVLDGEHETISLDLVISAKKMTGKINESVVFFIILSPDKTVWIRVKVANKDEVTKHRILQRLFDLPEAQG